MSKYEMHFNHMPYTNGVVFTVCYSNDERRTVNEIVVQCGCIPREHNYAKNLT